MNVFGNPIANMKLRVKHIKRLDFLLIILFTLTGIYFGIFIYSLRSEEQSIEITSYIASQTRLCYQSKASGQCYRDLAVNLLDKYKLPEILNELAKDVTQTGSVKLSACHNITHYLGREAYKRSNNIQQTFKQCNQICLTGCFHGVVEEHLAEKNLSIEDDNALEKEIQTLCGKEEDYDNFIKFQECLHGLGHGLMFLTENDLPRVLRLCESLSTQDEILNCQNGAFMENAHSNSEHPSKYIKEDDPNFPCSILDKKYLNNCYIYQSHRLVSIGKNDWKKIFQLCYTFPKDYWYQCFRSLGTFQPTISSDVEVMKANCALITDPDHRNICIGGVAEIFSHYLSSSNVDFSKTIKFCSIVDLENKGYCYTKMGQDLKKWTRSRSEMDAICSKIPEEEYRDVCISATKK